MASLVADRLRRLLGLFAREDRLLIVINADPDAMASAMALKRLLWRRIATAAIAHVNVISRPDNLAMIRLLKLDMTPLEKVDRSQFTRFAIVDSQPSHHEGFGGIAFDIVIDHHPIKNETGLPFVDIRPEYGATSTMMTQYLRAAKIKPSTKLATGLFYGIKTDTSNFERKALIDDVKAFQFLFRYANIHMASKIEQAEITVEFLKYYRKALDLVRIRKGKAHVYLGPVPTPDVCVSIADFFAKLHDVSWVVVSGTCGGKLIVIVRNDGFRKNAGKLVANAFGNLGPAGGHKAMARAEIPLQNLEGCVQCKDEKIFGRWIAKNIEARS
jgi:nanoRNase/pAp phosphatase (c-di-AMP/oligoRNAs hydrolase)